MKKMLSIGMAMIITISSVQIAFANTEKTFVSDPMDMFFESGIFVLEDKETLENGTDMYNIVIDGTKTEICRKITDEGNLYTFDDGQLTDEVLISTLGDVFLNGKRIEVLEKEIETSETSKAAISPRAYYETWETSNTDYSYGPYDKGGKAYRSTILLEQKIAQCTAAALAFTVVTALLGPAVGAGAARGVYDGMAEFQSWVIAYKPELASLYVEKRLWSNGRSDTNNGRIKYYYKGQIGYFPDSSFNVAKATSTFYAVQEITNH